MIIYVKNDLITWRGNSRVKDENDKELYQIKGKFKFFSPTRKKKIYNKEGKKIYTVRNKMWKLPFAFNSALIYDSEGEKIGRLQRKMSRTNRYILNGDYPDTIRIGKDEAYKGFTIFKNEEAIAYYHFDGVVRDSYRVDCISKEEKDIDLIVSLIIAIDNIQDKTRED